ncbi:hypothetical protein [Roseiconus lacunae]|uniref:hypothetical protein n=1 Tax=Roseiconus lacunae TaxID=2605694 RepID=UPI001E3F816E|nr:hypothetical protein [Roseiconus lacunae]MCD0460402.1 hypothetical protein [Roseiconus lacunae]
MLLFVRQQRRAALIASTKYAPWFLVATALLCTAADFMFALLTLTATEMTTGQSLFIFGMAIWLYRKPIRILSAVFEHLEQQRQKPPVDPLVSSAPLGGV